MKTGPCCALAAALFSSACSSSQTLRFENPGGGGRISVQRRGSGFVDSRPLPARYELEYSRKPGFIVMVVGGGLLIAGGLTVAGYLAAEDTNSPVGESLAFAITGAPLLASGFVLATVGGTILGAQEPNVYRFRFEEGGTQKTFDLRLPVPARRLGEDAVFRFDGEGRGPSSESAPD